MPENSDKKKLRQHPISKLWDKVRQAWKKDETNVYFISGMCYNCSVFDKLKLPKGFNKKYIEWHIPRTDESLDEYTHTMAREIDRSQPFILVGYSFGAVIMQEMNKFLTPVKSVIISSFKSEYEIPTLFKAVKRSNLTEYVPMRVYSSTEFITETFNRLIYHMPYADLAQYMTVIDPVYVKWAVKQITEWIPSAPASHLYHIHGTEDQIFPFEHIRNAFPVEGGDHLMVLRKAETVSLILGGILLMKEE